MAQQPETAAAVTMAASVDAASVAVRRSSALLAADAMWSGCRSDAGVQTSADAVPSKASMHNRVTIVH